MSEALPEVTQSFEADPTDWVAGLEAMIAEAEAFARANEAVVGSIEAIHAAVDALPLVHETVIRVSYETVGEPPPGVFPDLGGTGGIAAATAELVTLADAERAATAGAVVNASALAGESQEAQAKAMIMAVLAAAVMDLADAERAATTATVINTAVLSAASASAFASARGAAAAAGAAGNAGAAWGRWGGILAGTFAGVGVWHIALDLLVEGLISLGTAAMAAGVGIAVMAPTVDELRDHLTAVSVVNHALGEQIPGLQQQFDTLAHAMAPQTVEMYGGALNLVSGQTGVLGDVARQVVTIFDDWVAKIDLWAKGQGTFAGLLHTGVGYLQQFGSILGTVGQALGNILRSDPGIARFLLDLVGGTAKLLEIFTLLPGPILEFTLALHGAWLWGRVLYGIGQQLVGVFGRMYTGMLALAANPWAWAAAAAAALGYMAYESTQADSATKKFIATLNSKIDAASASQAILLITAAIGQLQDRINTVGSSAGLAQIQSHWADLSHTFSSTGDDAVAFGHDLEHAWDSVMKPGWSGLAPMLAGLGDALKSLVVPGQGAWVQQSRDIGMLNSEINQLLGNQRNLFHEWGSLVTGQNSLHIGALSVTEAWGLMNLAGVKATDSLTLMQTKVQNLVTGYENLSIRGGMLSNSVDAVTFATLQQDSKVGQLTQAWSTFFSTLAGGESGFVSFAQNMASLGTATDKANVSMTGLNANSLAARSQFLQTAQSAQAELNNLTMLASAAGLGARGTAMLTQASKDMVAAMLPAAKGSQALTTVLYALAQQGGYHGADAFQALAKWVGNVHDPMANLDKITTTLTVDAGNLATDVKNLSAALGTTLTGAINQAIFYADGGQKAFDNYATALKNTGIQSSTTRTAGIQLATELLNLTGNTVNAHREFDAMTIAMGYTKTQADKLWASIVNVAKAESTIKSKTVGITVDGTGAWHYAGAAGPTPPGMAGHPGFAHGGVIPGHDYGHDTVPAMLRGHESVMVPEFTDVFGAAGIHALNRLAEAGALRSLHQMVPHFAAGGIVPSYHGNVGGLGPWAVGNYNATVNQFASSLAGSMQSAMASAFSGDGGITGTVVGWIKQAMAIAGAPASWLGALERLVSLESGGNPNAHNPSGASGAWQMMPGTFAQYSRGGSIWNPVAEGVAALFYIMARWGSPYNIPGLMSGHYSGYANGTNSAMPGWAMVGENGPELLNFRGGESVFPLGGMGGQPITINLTVELDGQQIFSSKDSFQATQVSARRYNRRNGQRGTNKAFTPG